MATSPSKKPFVRQDASNPIAQLATDSDRAGKKEAVIDITLSNMDRSMISDWRVSVLSPITYLYLSLLICLVAFMPLRNPRRTNRIRYEEALEEELRALKGVSTPGINDRVGSLTDILLSCYRDPCSLTYPGKRSHGGMRNSSFNDYKREIMRSMRTTRMSFGASIDDVAEAARFRRMLFRAPKILCFVQKNNCTWTASKKNHRGSIEHSFSQLCGSR